MVGAELRGHSDVMTTTTDPTGPPPPPPGDGPRANREEMRDLARLRRTVGPQSKVAGVAGGLARHFDVDPLVIRVAMVVLVFFGGAGLIIYGACWLLVPQDDAPRAPFGLDDRSRSVALLVAGVIAALALVGDTIGAVGFPWPLVAIGVVALVVFAVLDRGENRPRPTAPPVPYAPPTGGAGSGPGYDYSWQYSATGAAQVTAGGPAHPSHPNHPQTYVGYTAPQPRKRGPKLFWFTAALSALAVGVLGTLDLAGVAVADSAYPALVLGIVGLMLLVGAFYGRAGGLIAVGLVAALVLAASATGERIDTRTLRVPATAAAVSDNYEFGVGEIVLDLTEIDDLEALDGREITLQAGLGSIEVILPEELDVRVRSQAGLGSIEVFGERQEGAGLDFSSNRGSGTDRPAIELDVSVGLGEIRIDLEDSVESDLQEAS
jgi:phage shock protein PspC (stress-responsive transcriptional regulator)